MSRRDGHLDTMLRQLGATCYHILHGHSKPAAVSLAGDSVAAADERHTRAIYPRSVPERAAPGAPNNRLAGNRWLVRDVMTTEIASVDEMVPYEEAAQLMSEWTVSAIPVTDQDRPVLGMVSEADLLRKQECSSGRIALSRRMRRDPGPWAR